MLTRKATLDDIDELDTLNRNCLKENYSVEVWEQFIEESIIYVAISEDNENKIIMGYIIIENITEFNTFAEQHFSETFDLEANNVYIIMSFGVLEEYRNKGIGSKLMKLVLEKNRSIVILNVRESNIGAQHIYLKYGFKIFKTKDEKYYKNPTEDAFLMYNLR